MENNKLLENGNTTDDFHQFLEHKANFIRKNLVDVAVRNGVEHIAPSLSCVDILVSLYYNVMNISKSDWENRDRFILSKGHGCYGFYSILADLGILDKEAWETFHKGSFLRGCVERNVDNGIETSCGSLGHGLPVAVGIAFGAKLQNKNYRVYCVVGDGEMQEGSMWEAIQFAAKYNLTNLTLIVDSNGLQAMDFIKNILSPEEFREDMKTKLAAFGFETRICNGHNVNELVENVNDLILNSNKPQAIVASTTKGYGLKCMENIPKFHFRMPTEQELKMGNTYECKL